MRYILDTHALVWHLANDARLGPGARQVLADPTVPLVVPVLVLAETKHVASRKRLPVSFDTVLETVNSSPRITVLPMNQLTVNYLPTNLDIHDAIIVASALYCRDYLQEDVAILTNDLAITNARLVAVVW